ncbi:MAG: arylamine N-acetyltransferase [Thermoanaerobaculia bacterium]
MLATDEILEALDLAEEEISHRFLERLFSRFNARVPFETVSKILRHADAADPARKAGSSEGFWEEHLAWGAGGTCFARVAGFAGLLEALGFRVERLLGRVEADFDHAALRVRTERGPVLADVGFPLPALLAEMAGETETPLAALEVLPTPRGWSVTFHGGVPDGPPGLEIFADPVTEPDFLARWASTFRPDSRFLRGVGARKMEEQRVVSFSRGEVRVDDRHSRLTVPIPPPRARRIAELFGLEEEPVQRAFEKTSDPSSELPGATLTAYLRIHASPEAAFAAIGSPDAYRRLMSGVARVALSEETSDGWRLELEAPEADATGGPGAERFAEEVRAEPGAARLEVRRIYPGRSYHSSFEARTLRGATYLVRRLTFEQEREDLLRNDSARGRLAGTLAVDLLAWARQVG